MPNYYIIDGYNIIYAWSDFKKILEVDFDHARDKLIALMSNFVAATGSIGIIVFDAHLVKSGTEYTKRIDDVEIYYTAQGETADSLIERLVGKLSRQGNVYVVTSDWDEQRIIFGRGAYRVTPKEFSCLVEGVKKETHSHVKPVLPTENYLENRLQQGIRKKLEQWRRQKY